MPAFPSPPAAILFALESGGKINIAFSSRLTRFMLTHVSPNKLVKWLYNHDLSSVGMQTVSNWTTHF
jgi:hypothetical protein